MPANPLNGPQRASASHSARESTTASSDAGVPLANLLPLEGVRVLELGHIVAGPAAGLILADLGADTIKVENPNGGDQYRRAPTRGFPFYNRNKRSVALDLKSDAGRAIFLRLVKTADVVLDNFASGALDSLGLGYERLREANSAIVYLSIKGFLHGPYEGRPAFDELAQMMGGLAFMTGPAGRPLRAGTSLIDIGAATYGVVAVMAALLRRQRTGLGEAIRAGLYETTVFLVGQWMAQAAASGEQSRPMPEHRMGPLMGWGVYDLFQSADGPQVFVGITSDKQWRDFCEALGLTALRDRADLASNEARVAARTWLLPMLVEALGRVPALDLVRKLECAGVPFADVKRPDELLEDSHLNESEQLLATPTYEGLVARLPKMPIRSSGYNLELRRGAPGHGEHTHEVLTELGYEDDELAELAAQGIVLIGRTFEQETRTTTT